jgi:riboflavin kinase/FMN adenylyltransferase
MKLYGSLNGVSGIKDRIVLVIGNFDGLHRGHVKIIRYAVKEARKNRAKCFALTFSNHPACVLKGVEPLLLQTKEEKVNMLEKLGVDGLLLLKFTKAFARQSPRQFLKKLSSRLRIIRICVGENFFFGKGNSGNISTLSQLGQELGFRLVAFPLLKDRMSHSVISSTVIRKSLLAGEPEKAARLLGYPYSIASVVVAGERLGNRMGFPTANFSISRIRKMLPAEGVYAARIRIGNKARSGLAYVGPKSVGGKKRRVFETWIKDWKTPLYGKTIRVDFLSYLRAPRKFNSPAELLVQIRKDRQKLNQLPRRHS